MSRTRCPQSEGLLAAPTITVSRPRLHAADPLRATRLAIGLALRIHAEPIGHDAERVFHFSKEDGSTELAVLTKGPAVSDASVRLAGSHRAGRYRLHVFLAERPLGREEMERGPDEPGVLATARVEVVLVE